MTEELLQHLFEPYGIIEHTSIPRTKQGQDAGQ